MISNEKCSGWNNYYVTNDHVLNLIKNMREAVGPSKEAILTSIVGQLGYLVQSKIKGYRQKPFYGDLLQEGKIGLLKAIKDFDPNRGPNFFKFACWHILHQVKLYINWQNKFNKMVEDDEDNYFGSSIVNSQDQFEEAEMWNIVDRAVESLPEMDKNVLCLHFGIKEEKSYTFKQIGEKYSLSKQRIEQIQKRAILRLQNNEEIKNIMR